MTETSPAVKDKAPAAAPAQRRHSWPRRHPWLSLSAILIALAALYWGLLASDRYVSETHLVVDRSELPGAPSGDLSALFGGSSRSSQDMAILRDHLRSVDMLKKLEAKLKLRAHYSDKSRDLLSRLWRTDASQEFFHAHYLARTGIDIDEQAGVLRIRAQAYDAATAQAIARTLVTEGEDFLNDMAHKLAREQVTFLEQQVSSAAQRALDTRRAMVDYQNRSGLLSPQATAESLSAIVARIEGQLSELKARRGALLGYLSADAPDVAQLNLQIGALEKQLAIEQRRLTSPKGGTLNRSVEEFQRLEAEAAFAQEVYKTALAGLERGRVEAVRKLKKVSVLQSPTLAEYPLEPARAYNLLVFALAVLALSGIGHLLAAIVRDHQD